MTMPTSVNPAARHACAAAAVLMLVTLAQPCGAAEPGIEQRWVSGSGVALREKPQRDARSLGPMALNTPLTLLRPDAGNGYCEVRTAQGRTGFTACQYLATAPVASTDARAQARPGDTPAVAPDPQRASASASGWDALKRHAAALAARRTDVPPHGPWPRDESLERMKAQLAQPRAGEKPAPMADWQTLKTWAAQAVRAAGNQPLWAQAGARSLGKVFFPSGGIFADLEPGEDMQRDLEQLTRRLHALELPTIRPSLFRAESEIGAPDEAVEKAAGRFGLKVTETVSPRPPVQPGQPSPGLWDMRNHSVQLAQPLIRVQLFRDGRLRAAPSTAARTETLWTDEDRAPECEDWFPGYSYGAADMALWRSYAGEAEAQTVARNSPNPPDSLYAFHVASPLPRDLAARSQTTVKLDEKRTGFSAGTHLNYDLDGDGVPDLAVWEGQGHGPGHLEGPTKTQDRWYRLVLVNIGGAWKVLGRDNFSYGCGC